MRARRSTTTILLLGIAVATPRGPLEGQDADALRAEATRTEAALRAEVRQAPSEADEVARTLEAGRRAALQRIAGALACGGPGTAEREWAAYVRAERPAPDDVMGLLFFILREAVREAADDVRFHLEKLEAVNGASAAIAAQMAELAEASRALERDPDRSVEVTETVTAEDAERLARFVRQHRAEACGPAPDAAPAPTLRPVRVEVHGADELQRRLAELERRIGDLGDDAQLSQIDLQNALARAQALLQALGEMSKAWHDTAMAVIRNISGDQEGSRPRGKAEAFRGAAGSTS